MNPHPSPSPEENGTDGERKRRKVTRSRLGCLTCRKRRKLCDQSKPICDACVRLGLECVWPTKQHPPQPEHMLGRQPRTNATTPPIIQTPVSTSPNSRMMTSGASSVAGPSRTNTGDTMSDFVNIWWENGIPPDQTGVAAPPPPPPLNPLFAAPLAAENGMVDFSGILGDGFNFDETTLQMWATDCLSGPTLQPANPFDSLSSLLLSSNTMPPPPSTTPLTIPSSEGDSERQEQLATSSEHAPLSKYYNQFLRGLVACGDPNNPGGVDSFTALANATASTSAGKGLQLGTLAWAGKHMVNQGQLKYEAVSEKLGDEASRIVLQNVTAWRRGWERGIEGTETERLTLMAGILMLIQFKNTRGDVWGFQPYMDHLLVLSRTIYTPGSQAPEIGSVPYNFLGNLCYHDVLSSFIYYQDPLVPASIITAYSYPTERGWPITEKISRVAQLVRKRREQSLERDWVGAKMEHVIAEAVRLEREFEEEQVEFNDPSKARGDFETDIFLQIHEPCRLAAILTLRSEVLCEPPNSLSIRLMVRKALSLCEALYDRNLPGFFSALWIMHTAGCLAVPGGAAEGEMDERERVERLYEDMVSMMGFMNAQRSLKIVQEVWARNMEGRLFVDWLDILKEWDWELFLV